jgi:hypothetical protein
VSSSNIAVTVAPDAKAKLVFAVKVVNVPAAGVVPPIVASTVPALISAVSATKLSMFAVPSIYKSLNSNKEVPKSISLSVTGTIAPSCILICSTAADETLT